MNQTTIAAFTLALGVVIGAFGAHGLRSSLDAYSLGVYETGVQYHFYHALAILGVAFATRDFSSSLIPLSGWLFLLGIILFSGSLYVLSLTGKRWLGAITPLGGLAFLAGWVCLALGALQK